MKSAVLKAILKKADVKIGQFFRLDVLRTRKRKAPMSTKKKKKRDKTREKFKWT